MSEVTKEGEQRIKRYESALETLKRAKAQVNSAECEATNATNELARWLAPDNMRAGETIGVWVEGEIYMLTKKLDGPTGYGDFNITKRAGTLRKGVAA